METTGQINHTATARTMTDRLPQISHQGVETVESMIPWNTYSHSYARNAAHQRLAQTSHKTNFYEDEYKKMVLRMDKKVLSAKKAKSIDPFGELVQLSVLADEGYPSGDLSYIDSLPTAEPQPWKIKSRVSIHSLLKWKRYQDEKHELFMSMMRKLEVKDIERFRNLQMVRKQRKMSFAHGEFDENFRVSSATEQREVDFRMSNTSEGDSSMGSMPDGDFMGSSPQTEDFRMVGMQDEDIRKGGTQSGDSVMGATTEDDFMVGSTGASRHLEEKRMNVKKQTVPKSTTKTKVAACRHFTKGWCRQGDSCSFQHSIEGSHPDTHKVFLGGLPHSITPAKLMWELRQKGYIVVNQPKIFRGFSPQVCLSSATEAMKLLQQGKIMICGSIVDVRPYKASTKKERDRQLDTNNRSIFLGGLPSSVTVQILKTEIEKLGMKVTNRPLIKAGFIPKVTLASVQQAQTLITKGLIDINGAVVSVRPYISKNNPC